MTSQQNGARRMAKSKQKQALGRFEVASADDLGFSKDRLAIVKAALDRVIEQGDMPGCVIAIARHGQLAYQAACGVSNPANSKAMTTQTLFSIASMTKPIVSVAILQLFEQGRLLLGDSIETHLPELRDLNVGEVRADGKLAMRPAARQPTIHDLLRHTSGLTYQNRGTSALYQHYPGSSNSAPTMLTKEETLETLAECPLLFEPGSAWEYGFSTDVLGFVVEALCNKPLGEALKASIFDPLGMSETRFDLPKSDRSRYAHAFKTDPATGEANSVMHVDGKERHWQPGGGGLVSTAADYLNFAQMLLDAGGADGRRVLGRKTVELMTSGHLGPDIDNRIADTMDPACDGYGFGLGVAVRAEDGRSASAGPEGDVYWSGVYGTYFWVDPIEDLAVVFMAACPGPTRLRLRQLVRSLVYQAIAD